MADKLVTFDYNDNGQFVSISRYASLEGSQLVAVSDYAYDQYNRPVSLVHHQPPSDPPATQPTLPSDNRQRATNNGQLPTDHGLQRTDNALAAYTWTWEGGGNMVKVVQAGAASGPQFGAGWMLPFGGSVHTSRELEITPLPDYIWTFDTAFIGHLVQTTSTDGTVDYQYDPRGQLINADYTASAGLPDTASAGLSTSVGAGLPTVPPDELYTYDANGNRTNPGYITGDHNRLLSDGTYDYQYDAEGNRTRRIEIATGEVTEYHWDHRNRLVRVTTRTTDNGPLTIDTSFAYDYLNRWIARSHDPDGDGPLGFTDTYFVYDGTPPSGSLLDRAAVTMENIGQIVLHFESDAQGEPQLAHRYLWGPAVDQILADEQITDPTAPGNIVWSLTDHLNTVRDLAIYDANTDTTTIVNHLIYDAYGRITSQSDPDQTTLFAFTARPFDPATGLQNNLNRWYDAEIGRWLSEDPIGFRAGDASLYRYVENMPTLVVDPSGLGGEFRNLTLEERRFFQLFFEAILPHADRADIAGLLSQVKLWDANSIHGWHTLHPWNLVAQASIYYGRAGAVSLGRHHYYANLPGRNDVAGWALIGHELSHSIDAQVPGGSTTAFIIFYGLDGLSARIYEGDGYTKILTEILGHAIEDTINQLRREYPNLLTYFQEGGVNNMAAELQDRIRVVYRENLLRRLGRNF